MKVLITFEACVEVEVDAPDNYDPKGTIAEMGDIEDKLVQEAQDKVDDMPACDLDWSVEDVRIKG